MIDTLILDFDGVILESVSLKTEAFRDLFSFVPDHIEDIIDFAYYNGGMSRYEKFERIYQDILKEELTDEISRQLGERYAEIISRKILQVPFVDGAYDLLMLCCGKIPLFIVSGTPEDEMKKIIQLKSLETFFIAVYGSPKRKSDCISEILRLTRSGISETLFVGDSINDWQAAQETGVRFIARVNPTDTNRFSNLPGIEYIVKDLGQLSRYLETEVHMDIR